MTSLVRPRDAIGIELEMTTVVSDKASKGNLYFLVAGADGPIRGNGANYQSAYDLFLPEPSTRVMILMKNPPTSGGSIRYSQCPRLMEMSGSSPGADFVLAPF
jgi:hypothetical protein